MKNPQIHLKLLEEKLKGLWVALLSPSPFKPFKKGYALVKTYPEGHLVYQAAEVKSRQKLKVQFEDGTFLGRSLRN